MAIKSSSPGNDDTDKPKKVTPKVTKAPAKATTTEEKVEAVARKARKTAVKVASAVSATVKDIAEKVGARKPAVKKPAAKATQPGAVLAPTPPTAETKKKPAAPKKSTTRVGALSEDVNSSDVNDAILDNLSSTDISKDASTDVKEHFFHDKHNHQGPPPPQAPRDLPDEYGDTKLILMVRDPEWAYAYWEINENVRQNIGLPRDTHDKNVFLRLFKITDRQWPQEPAHYFFDVEVDRHAHNWYLRLPEPNEQWCAELGIMDDHQNFVPIVTSNPIITPRNTISDHVDSEWMTVEESFQKITRLSDSHMEARLLGQEKTGSEAILRQIHKQLTGVLHGERANYSSGIFSSESALPMRANKRFWLEVKTELILYGATEPDAIVTVQGRTIPLNADGTFSIRYSLPDGEQVLNVHAVNADGDLEETITPIVTRTTT